MPVSPSVVPRLPPLRRPAFTRRLTNAGSKRSRRAPILAIPARAPLPPVVSPVLILFPLLRDVVDVTPAPVRLLFLLLASLAVASHGVLALAACSAAAARCRCRCSLRRRLCHALPEQREHARESDDIERGFRCMCCVCMLRVCLLLHGREDVDRRSACEHTAKHASDAEQVARMLAGKVARQLSYEQRAIRQERSTRRQLSSAATSSEPACSCCIPALQRSSGSRQTAAARTASPQQPKSDTFVTSKVQPIAAERMTARHVRTSRRQYGRCQPTQTPPA